VDLSVVVLSWNTRDLVRDCLEALGEDGFPGSREVVLVDQASSDGTAEMVKESFPRVRLVQAGENLGYARGNNLGAKKARGRWLCLLGSDTRVRTGALEGLTAFLEGNPEYGAAAPKLVGRGGEVQKACMNFPGIFTALTFDNVFSRFPPGKWIQDRYYMRGFDHLSPRDVDQPPGTCLVLSREEYLAMGGMDPSLFLFFNDVDLCKRLRLAGRKIRYIPSSVVVHEGGASTSRYGRMAVQWQLDRLAFYRKWFGRWTGPLLKLLVLERAWEERRVLMRRHKDPEERKQALDDLNRAVREVLRG